METGYIERPDWSAPPRGVDQTETTTDFYGNYLLHVFGNGIEVEVVNTRKGIRFQVAFQFDGLFSQEVAKGMSPFRYVLFEGLSPLEAGIKHTEGLNIVLERLTLRWVEFYERALSVPSEFNPKQYEELYAEHFQNGLIIEVTEDMEWFGEFMLGLAMKEARQRLQRDNLSIIDPLEYLTHEKSLIDLWIAESDFVFQKRDTMCCNLSLRNSWLWSWRFHDRNFSEESYIFAPHFVGDAIVLYDDGIPIPIPPSGYEEMRVSKRSTYKERQLEYLRLLGLSPWQICVYMGLPGGGKSTTAAALLRLAELNGYLNRYGDVHQVKVSQTLQLKRSLEARFGDEWDPVVFAGHADMTKTSVAIVRRFIGSESEKFEPSSILHVLQTGYETPLCIKVSLEQERIWTFIKELEMTFPTRYPNGFASRFLESLQFDAQVYVPIEIRWFIESLIFNPFLRTQIPGLITGTSNDLGTFVMDPLGWTVCLDTPTVINRRNMRIDMESDSGARREKFSSYLETIRLVNLVFARQFQIPIFYCCFEEAQDVVMHHPIKMAWFSQYTAVTSRIGEALPLIIGAEDHKSEFLRLMNVLKGMISPLTTRSFSIDLFSPEALGLYCGFTEYASLLDE